MAEDPVDRLVKLGFSEYEAKAYVALLRKSPVTGYELSKLSGVPRSMIYEVLGKLTARGAAMTLRIADGIRYAPVPATEFLEKLRREHEELITSLKEDLAALATAAELYEYVWNLKGHETILARAREMLARARERVYLALVPGTCEELQADLAEAVSRGVRVVLYSSQGLDLPGAETVCTPLQSAGLSGAEMLGLILVVDGEEALIAEDLGAPEARASWTSSPLLVFIVEHHLRTDLYLPRILALLGEKALEVIREEDRELFARALESHTPTARRTPSPS
ncbi:MAG: TrmB family transcriptional regulator [Anaerolineae bacterium]